jgi:hypothetical protein
MQPNFDSKAFMTSNGIAEPPEQQVRSEVASRASARS